jgi:signal transduction histidine kinase
MNSGKQNRPPANREALEIRCAQLERELVEQQREVAAFKRQLGKSVSLQEFERQRLSRDIHDSLGQLLTGLRMEFTSLQNKLEQPKLNRPEILDLVRRADQLIERIQKSTRDLVSFQQPRIVVEKGLAAAIQSIVRENEQYGDIQYETIVEVGDNMLDRDQAIAVYRIVQECVTNILRHARASRVRIRCICESGFLILEIDDDGIGYDTTAESSMQGWGLYGIRARVHSLNGTVSIESARGRGVRIYVEIPLVKGMDGKDDKG